MEHSLQITYYSLVQKASSSYGGWPKKSKLAYEKGSTMFRGATSSVTLLQRVGMMSAGWATTATSVRVVVSPLTTSVRKTVVVPSSPTTQGRRMTEVQGDVMVVRERTE